MESNSSQPDNGSQQTSAVDSDDEVILSASEKQELFSLLGKSHMITTAALLANSSDPWRFNEIRDTLEVSQATLSSRLTELIEQDLVIRYSYDENPPRVEYEATQKLKDFKPIVSSISKWWRYNLESADK